MSSSHIASRTNTASVWVIAHVPEDVGEPLEHLGTMIHGKNLCRLP